MVNKLVFQTIPTAVNVIRTRFLTQKSNVKECKLIA